MISLFTDQADLIHRNFKSSSSSSSSSSSPPCYVGLNCSDGYLLDKYNIESKELRKLRVVVSWLEREYKERIQQQQNQNQKQKQENKERRFSSNIDINDSFLSRSELTNAVWEFTLKILENSKLKSIPYLMNPDEIMKRFKQQQQQQGESIIISNEDVKRDELLSQHVWNTLRAGQEILSGDVENQQLKINQEEEEENNDNNNLDLLSPSLLCIRYGQPWRAASLLGSIPSRDLKLMFDKEAEKQEEEEKQKEIELKRRKNIIEDNQFNNNNNINNNN